MRYCANCGAPLDDDALFCSECGTRVEQQPEVPQPAAAPDPVAQEYTQESMETVRDAMETVREVNHEANYMATETYAEVNDNNLYYIIGAVVLAVVLGLGGWWWYSNHNKSNNNPLGVEKPKWEKFVMVNTENAVLYKEANNGSPNLQEAMENIESDVADKKLMWKGDKKPRGYNVYDYFVMPNTVYPVIDENDEWYKVYIGSKEITEAYLEKWRCEEVKPEPITKDIIDSVKTDKWNTHRLVEKGEFANLYLEREYEYSVESVNVGVLTEGCIIIPDGSWFYPCKKDTTGVDIRDVSASPEEFKHWQMVCPGKYWGEQSAEEYSAETFDVNLLDDSDLNKVVTALRPTGKTGLMVYYYFPTVATDRFIEFEYSFSPAAVSETEEQQPVATKYKVEGEKLKAWLGDEERTVKLNFENINLISVKDLDGDGSMEAVICHFMSAINGEPVDCPIVVYYDAEADEFKHTEGMELTVDPTFEENGDGYTILQREGLKAVRYKFAEGKLTVTDDSFKNIGHVIGEIKLEELFEFGTDGEKTVGADFFGNDPDDVAKLTFTYESGGYYHGLKMALTDIELLNGKTHSFVSMAAEKFKFLKEKTNGMPDIIGDNYLYRWKGSYYGQYGWDGKNFVECD